MVSSVSAFNYPKIWSDPTVTQFEELCFSELKKATNDFGPDAMFEEAGFDLAFKGWIDECSLKPSRPDTGMAVAIKVFNQKGCPDRQELLAEIKYMGHLYHPNLVQLIGYCLEGDYWLLVYEFMPNGSLENQLFGGDSQSQPLSWNLRMKIALGAAKCLAFLHDEADIIYRDFKTSKILLDSNYNAKLSGLGLAKDGPIGCKSHVSTRVLGTEGYAAPEYMTSGHAYMKSDVYSFGVVLLEMLSGRKAIDKNKPREEENLAEWARSISNTRNISRILNPAILGEHSGRSALKVAQLACICVSKPLKSRPGMKEVVLILENLQDCNENKVCKSSTHYTSSNGSDHSRAKLK